MILIDANLLIYASVPTMGQHGSARDWLNEVLNGTTRVGLPWASLLAYVRIVTNPKLFAPPVSIRQAWKQVEEWLSLECAWVPSPTERHAEFLSRTIVHASGPKLVPDAHLAALAIEHGLELCSTDGDFARFPALRWRNPILGTVV